MKKIIGLLYCLTALGANAQQTPAPPKFNAKERNEVIDTLAKKIEAIYSYENIAKEMAKSIRLHQQHHDYDTVSSRAALAPILTSHLQAISHDGHLGVEYSPTLVTTETPGNPPAEVVNAFRQTWARSNFNFKKVEHLDGNVGLFQLDTFFPADWVKDLAAASMTLLANSNAVIIDLRQNHGYAPDGVLLIESYFFSDATHLSDGYDRNDKTVTQTWTMPTVPGPKLADMALYVLVGKDTFSAPESFAYNLQALGRAKIVGEVTGGGAHGTRPYKIGTYFIADIPSGYSSNTITHTDWEGKGVQPDVNVPADQALLTAQIMAIRDVISKNSADTERVNYLNSVIAQLQPQLDLLKQKH